MRGWQFSDLLLVLVVLAVVSLLTTDPATAATDYEPVGDELFDRTAQWVLKELKQQEAGDLGMALMWLLNPGPHENMYPPAVDLTELLSWESEFGDDPRYWQLLLRTGNIEPALAGIPYSAPTPIIDQQAFVEKLELLSAGTDSYFVLSWRVLAGKDEERALQLVESAINLDPANSFFYYRKADILQGLGELDGAREAVRQGNAARRNYVPEPFPQNVLRQHRDEFTTHDSRVAAAVLWCDSRRSGNYITWKEKAKEVCVACALGMPVELADEYLLRYRRAGQMHDQCIDGQVVAATCATILIDYITEYCLILDPQQTAERDAISHALAQVRANAIETASSEYGTPPSFTLFGGSLLPLGKPEPELWDAILRQLQCAEDNKPLFDILDPPPFAIWARGELVGIDTASVDGDGSERGDSSRD